MTKKKIFIERAAYYVLTFFFFARITTDIHTHPEMENTSECYSDGSEHDFSSSFDSSDTDVYHNITSSIMPYAFEPTIDSTSDYSLPSVPSVDTQHDDQNEDENWCRCGKCRIES